MFWQTRFLIFRVNADVVFLSKFYKPKNVVVTITGRWYLAERHAKFNSMIMGLCFTNKNNTTLYDFYTCDHASLSESYKLLQEQSQYSTTIQRRMSQDSNNNLMIIGILHTSLSESYKLLQEHCLNIQQHFNGEWVRIPTTIQWRWNVFLFFGAVGIDAVNAVACCFGNSGNEAHINGALPIHLISRDFVFATWAHLFFFRWRLHFFIQITRPPLCSLGSYFVSVSSQYNYSSI